MMVKDLKIKTLETGDKQGEIVLRTLYATDVRKLAELIDEIEIDVDFIKIKD